LPCLHPILAIQQVPGEHEQIRKHDLHWLNSMEVCNHEQEIVLRCILLVIHLDSPSRHPLFVSSAGFCTAEPSIIGDDEPQKRSTLWTPFAREKSTDETMTGNRTFSGAATMSKTIWCFRHCKVRSITGDCPHIIKWDYLLAL
jgi:hypothetical protein